MKKIGSLALTTILACGIAVPAFAAGGNDVVNDNAGINARPNAATVDRTPAGTFNGVNDGVRRTTNVVPRATGYGMDGYRMNNVVRARAADNDVDWGWLGLIGLIGLAGLRGRERNPNR